MDTYIPNTLKKYLWKEPKWGEKKKGGKSTILSYSLILEVPEKYPGMTACWLQNGLGGSIWLWLVSGLHHLLVVFSLIFKA